MATVKVKWRPSAVEGRTGTIYYQIIHDRIVRQLKTDYKIFAEEWESGYIMTGSGISGPREEVLASIREKVNGDVRRINAIIGKFADEKRLYKADDIAAAFAEMPQKPGFFGFMQNVISGLKCIGKHRTADNYTMTLKSFAQFRSYRDLPFCEMDSDMMMRYEAYLFGRGVKRNTVSFYMRILRAVYNRAVGQGQTEQRSPFRHVYTGVDKTVKRAISFAAVRRIKELDLSLHQKLDFARDMFLFSFYTRGMSFIDMAYLRKSDLKSGILSYCRRKTGQQLHIRWEKCMQEIVSKYEESRCPEDGSPYLLPILKPPFDNHLSRYKNAMQQINRSLKTVAASAGLDVPLTMYVARHSWASIAKSKNIPVSVISEGMGHDSEMTTRIYLASLDTSVIDRANRLILRDL